MTMEKRHWLTRLSILAPYAWLAVFFLVPFLIVLKISLSQTAVAQPPYEPVLDLSAGWAGFKHAANGYFYWHGVHWRHNNQKKIGDRDQDVWANSVTFDNRAEAKADNGFINGDGVLVYPGQEKLHPEQDRGIAGPISTISVGRWPSSAVSRTRATELMPGSIIMGRRPAALAAFMQLSTSTFGTADIITVSSSFVRSITS